ncbi:590c0793-41eb-4516-a665-f6c263a231ef [Sclerotinia trifoliorum]|uniref:590c0793-41eb-4516-a665-f6c263a231ef n=1 Tax=Sclerotinia trifoliorum TaxID=28548 RepID=A0A8H2W251_9HELO|nr:590c0793-41eb-4516-a665-f6c263a231ef [Sclerotinia trifoliorum]
MDITTAHTIPLAEASQFEEWLKMAMKWKVGKHYRRASPSKEEKIDGSKGELISLSIPAASSLKSTSSSSLNSSVSVRSDSVTSSLALSTSEAPSLTAPFLASETVVAPPDHDLAINSDATTPWIADLPYHPKSLAPRSPPSPPSPSPKPESGFKNEFFEIKSSPKGGLGCFARTDIESGTIIHSEEPLFISSILQIYHNFEQLTAKNQATYLGLHCWHGLANHKILAIFQTNRFHISGGKAGIFLNSSRFNHACPGFRNCSYNYDKDSNRMIFTTTDAVKKDQELTISYASIPNSLYQNYGFFCDCPGCPPSDSAYRDWRNEDRVRRNAERDGVRMENFEPDSYSLSAAWENDVYKW